MAVRGVDISNVLRSLQYLGEVNAQNAELDRREKEKKSGLGAQLGGIAGGIAGAYITNHQQALQQEEQLVQQ